MRPTNSSNLVAACGRLIAPIVLITATLGSLNTPVIYCQQQQNNSNSNSNIFQQLSTILTQQPSSPVVYRGTDDEYSTTTLDSSMLKTYIRINNMRAYHLDLHSYRPKAKYFGDPRFVDSENGEHKARCANHLNQYKQLLKSFNELDPVLAKNSLDSLRLADAFGRPESGILSGNQFWLGSYDTCLDFAHKPQSASTANQQMASYDATTSDDQQQQQRQQVIQGQYCLGLTQFPNWNPQDSKTSIKVGLCLPETCTSSMLNENVELLETVETMMKYQIASEGPFNRLKLRSVYCLPHDTSPARQYSLSAICFLLLMGLFVSASLIATTIDYLNTKLPENFNKPQERNWRTIVVESFSIIKNLDKFFQIRGEDSKQDAALAGQQVSPIQEGSYDRDTFLNSMTGIKCIGLFWIICAHTFLVGPITSKNLIHTDKLTKTYLADIYLTAHLMVDTFFALSGLLAAYFLFKNDIRTIKTSHWIFLTLHRYWRLTPIYLICYWFTKSVGFLTNTGPMWDYMTAEQSPRLNCAQEPWSEALLHMSDYKSPKEHCVPFAWFIANGMKFWMVTPVFLVLIHKSMRRGYMVTMGTILANIVLVAWLAMTSSVDMKSVIEFKPESADNMLNNMSEIYTRPYSRIGAYLIGLLAGHLMYLIDTNQMEVKLSKNTKTIIWTLFSITVIVLMFVLKIASGIQLEDSVIPWMFGISSALIRPLWAICTCWFVFALAHGQARWVAKFLSANCWRILVKLSFCAYLAQGEVIAQLFLATKSAELFTYTDMICKSIVIIVITLAVSFLMVLLLEYPLIGIEELILPKRRKDPSPKPESDVKVQCEKLKSS